MLKSIFKFSISTWANSIINVLYVLITTRIFLPDILGALNVFSTTILTIMALACLGMDNSLFRFYNEPPEENTSKQLTFKLISIAMVLVVIFGVLATVFFYNQFSEIVIQQGSRLICALIFASVTAQVLLRFLNISYRMSFNIRKFNVQSILIQFVKLIVVFSVFISPIQIETVLVLGTVGICALMLFYVVIQRKDIVPEKIDFNFAGYRQIFKYSLFSAPLLFLININTLLTQQIIRRAINMAAVGIFSAATYFVGILVMMQGGFATYWSAYMYANYKKEQKRIINTHDFVMMFLLGAFILMVVFKDPIYVLIGSEYHDSKAFFALVLIYPILTFATETTAHGINIIKKNYLFLITYVISITINLVGSLILVEQFGLMGVAVASCVSGVCQFILLTFFGQKYYRSVENIRRTSFCVILILAVAFSVTFLKSNLFFGISMMSITVLSGLLYRTKIKVLWQMMLNKTKRRIP